MSDKSQATHVRHSLALVLYERLVSDTYANEKPVSLQCVWVDGDVDFYSLADAALEMMDGLRNAE